MQHTNLANDIKENANAEEAKRIEDFIVWAKDNAGLDPKITEAVIKQFTVREFLDYAENVSDNGISGGYNGFTFYTETVDFYEKNRKPIIEWAKEYNSSIGLEPSFLITFAQAPVFKNKDFSIDELAELIYSQEASTLDGYDIFCNNMSWIVAEEVCNAYPEFIDQQQ